jgi:hypothetical protein
MSAQEKRAGFKMLRIYLKQKIRIQDLALMEESYYLPGVHRAGWLDINSQES